MLIDITGKRYNRLEVKAFSHMVGKRSYWVCRCDCGKKPWRLF